MKIIIKKLTDEALMRRACEMTMHGTESKLTLDKIYQCEHSPMRTQLFWIEMLGILPALAKRLQGPPQKNGKPGMSLLYPLLVGNTLTRAMNKTAELGLDKVNGEMIAAKG